MYPKLRECPSVKLMSFPTPSSLQHEILCRYLFNQFFCGHLDRLGGNMSAVMERPPSQNRTQQISWKARVLHIPHFANCRTLFFVESIAKCRYLCRRKHIYMSIVKFSYHCNSIVNGPYPLKHMHSTQHTNEQQLNQPRLVAAFCRWWKVVITLWTLCAVSRPR